MVKRRMFAMRNGVIADVLRRNGSPYKIIFGLNLPQLDEMALELGKDKALAKELWQNNSTRESMLLAPMLMSVESVTIDEAIKLVGESPCCETTDILCHKLLRKHPESYEIARRLMDMPDAKYRYAALRLLWHHIAGQHREEIKKIAEAEYEKNEDATQTLCRAILDEISFWN